MPRRRSGVNTAFLQGEDPEADLMGGKAETKRDPPPAPAVAPAPAEADRTTTGTADMATRRAPAAARPVQRRQAPRPGPPTARRWQRVNVYLEPKTQGHWLNRTRGRLLEHDRGDIGVTEIVRLALDRLAEQLTVSDLVADYDRRYGTQEDT